MNLDVVSVTQEPHDLGQTHLNALMGITIISIWRDRPMPVWLPKMLKLTHPGAALETRKRVSDSMNVSLLCCCVLFYMK